MSIRMAGPSRCITAATRDTPGIGSGKTSQLHTWRTWLISKGATGKTLHEQERNFLIANGATGKTYNELLGSFLTTRGYTVGSLRERYKAWLTNGTV